MDIEKISFKQDEYDTQSMRVWAFNSQNDVIEGINIRVGNMVSGFPFIFEGQEFLTSKAAYICGAYGRQGQEAMQEEIRKFTGGGLRLKMMYRNRKEVHQYIREDWTDGWNYEFMLLVVWSKCLGNKDFRDLLMSIPDDVVIVENGTKKRKGTIWGCELNGNVWKGQNVMGKCLMLCKEALRNGTVPPIDYNLLNNKNIWWFGKKLQF